MSRERIPSIQTLLSKLRPNQRLWVNANGGAYADGRLLLAGNSEMVGGIYRDELGAWYVYSADVTDGARDSVAAYRELCAIMNEFGEYANFEWGVEDYR